MSCLSGYETKDGHVSPIQAEQASMSSTFLCLCSTVCTPLYPPNSSISPIITGRISPTDAHRVLVVINIHHVPCCLPAAIIYGLALLTPFRLSTVLVMHPVPAEVSHEHELVMCTALVRSDSGGDDTSKVLTRVCNTPQHLLNICQQLLPTMPTRNRRVKAARCPCLR